MAANPHGRRIVDYQTAENQAIQLSTQANQVGQELKELAGKLQSKIAEPTLARELTLDLREVAMAVQQQNQSALMLIQQMAQYIHALESNLAVQGPAPGLMQPRGWAGQPFPTATGGFMGNVVSGLGIGAGLGLGEDLINSIFGRW